MDMSNIKCRKPSSIIPLCPHLFQVYLSKVSEIFNTYKDQIKLVVDYPTISIYLRNVGLIKRKEHDSIMKVGENGGCMMEMVLPILSKRMWGLEHFLTYLYERKVSQWLIEELFRAYIRHLSVHIKRTQNEMECLCFTGGSKSILYKSWIKLLHRADSCILETGNAFRFLSFINPLRDILNFVGSKLPASRVPEPIILDISESDTEEDERKYSSSLLSDKEEFSVDEGFIWDDDNFESPCYEEDEDEFDDELIRMIDEARSIVSTSTVLPDVDNGPIFTDLLSTSTSTQTE